MSAQHIGKCKAWLLLVTLLISSVSAFVCPDHCDCSIMYEANTEAPSNYAKCTSLAGLKGNSGGRSGINAIDLSSIGLRRMSTSLESFKNLTELDLSYNKLTEVNQLNKRILSLNLRNNHLQSNKLSKIPEFIQHLDLSHNLITYIPRDLMRFSRLKKLELAGNPIYCNCETIQVRNWLQEQHVWSDKVIKCSSPLKYRGQSWLQVKQSDVCDLVAQKKNPAGYGWSIDSDEDEGNMMFGDSPLLNDEDGGSGDGEVAKEVPEEENDELNSSFMAVGSERAVQIPNNDEDDEYITYGPQVAQFDEEIGEGSGFAPAAADYNEETSTPSVGLMGDAEEDDGGSGSGSGAGILPVLVAGDTVDEDPKDLEDHEGIFTPSYDSLDIFRNSTPVASDPSGTSGGASDTEIIKGASDIDKSKDNISDEPKAASTDDKGVYILLAIVGIVFIGLLVLVALKRKKQTNADKRRYDPEAANVKSTEMKPMDKNNIGKANEFIPLMGEKRVEKPVDSLDSPKLHSFKPLKSDADIISEPLLKKLAEPEDKVASKASLYDNLDSPPTNNNVVPLTNGNVHDVEPTPTPAPRMNGPTSEEPTQNGYPYQNGDPNDEVFLPSAPEEDGPNPASNESTPAKSDANPSRYSPVYSPETGRVKIKLTQTPKPKTPLLVNRSRSNAGDIITSPAYSPRSARHQND